MFSVILLLILLFLFSINKQLFVCIFIQRN